MLRRYVSPILAGLAILTVTADLRAQATADQPITLAFKHVAGRVRKYRLGSTSEMTMTPQGMGGGGGLGPIPITLKSEMLFTEKVAGTRDGKATLAVTPLTLVMDTGVMGMNMQMKMEGGKLTMNGQPIPEGQLGPAAGMLSARPITVRRNALGQLEAEGAPNAALGQLLSSSFLIQLPEKPVKVGDAWETVLKMPTGIPGGGPLPLGPAAAQEVKFVHTLKALEMTNGRLHAVIESAGKGPAPDVAAPAAGATTTPAPTPAPTGTSYTGTTRFDVEQGAIVGGKYNSEVHLTLPLAGLLGALGGGGGAGAGGGAQPALPEGLKIDGLIAFELGELPYVAPAAKPAPKKPASGKPAAKKPSVKRG